MSEENKTDETKPTESAPSAQPAAEASSDAPAIPPPDSIAERPKPEEVREERMDRLRRKQGRLGGVPQLSQAAAIMPGMPGLPRDDEMERELQEAMGGLSEKEMYGQEQQRPRSQTPAPQGRKKGKILSVHGPDVFVELPGNRSQGLLPMTQFPEGKPQPGTEIEVEIEGYDNANGLLILTRKGAAVQADWSTVANGMVVEARVVETNKGGLTVMVNNIRGFMPISQIDLFRVENAEQFVNERLLCMVTDADPVEKNLVVSRRALLEQQREEQREQKWQELAEGQIQEGVVRKVENFGAFVDLGGVDGLLHVSEMSWARVHDPREVVQPGQRVKVVVLRLDRERRKISLGLKQLERSPWDTIQDKYPIGSIVNGKVTKLMEFGAFVELEPGIEGLVHISELAGHRVNRPGEVVQPEQQIAVKVLSIDRDNRRISLSLREAQKAATEAAEAETTPEQAEEPKAPPRPRPTNLRGGLGSK